MAKVVTGIERCEGMARKPYEDARRRLRAQRALGTCLGFSWTGSAPVIIDCHGHQTIVPAAHLAFRDVHQCTSTMIDWWFRFRPETREYVWWHPHDHTASRWRSERPCHSEGPR